MSQKLSIQNKNGEIIVGILEKKEAIDFNRLRPRIILITHGVLGKNKQVRTCCEIIIVCHYRA